MSKQELSMDQDNKDISQPALQAATDRRTETFGRRSFIAGALALGGRIFIPISPRGGSPDSAPTPAPTPTPESTPTQRLPFEQYHLRTEPPLDSESSNGVVTELRRTPGATFTESFVSALRERVAIKVAEHSGINNSSFFVAEIIICKNEEDVPQGQTMGWSEINRSQDPSVWDPYGIGFKGSQLVGSRLILYFAPREDLETGNSLIMEKMNRSVVVSFFAMTKSGRDYSQAEVLKGDSDTINLINQKPLLTSRASTL